MQVEFVLLEFPKRVRDRLCVLCELDDNVHAITSYRGHRQGVVLRCGGLT